MALQEKESISSSTHLYVYFTVGVLYYSCAPLIPLLTSLLSPRFRTAFVRALLFRRAQLSNGSRSGHSRDVASNYHIRRESEAPRNVETGAMSSSQRQIRSNFRTEPVMFSSIPKQSRVLDRHRHHISEIAGGSGSNNIFRAASTSAPSIYSHFQTDGRPHANSPKGGNLSTSNTTFGLNSVGLNSTVRNKFAHYNNVPIESNSCDSFFKSLNAPALCFHKTFKIFDPNRIPPKCERNLKTKLERIDEIETVL